jgi:hypothetical protein
VFTDMDCEKIGVVRRANKKRDNFFIENKILNLKLQVKLQINT